MEILRKYIETEVDIHIFFKEQIKTKPCKEMKYISREKYFFLWGTEPFFRILHHFTFSISKIILLWK